MGESLRHRGPDDHGIYMSGQVGLAHRRLSVLDLSSAGHQPMSNEDGTLWITTSNGLVQVSPSISSNDSVYRKTPPLLLGATAWIPISICQVSPPH